jgi:hypothetical protein
MALKRSEKPVGVKGLVGLSYPFNFQENISKFSDQTRVIRRVHSSGLTAACTILHMQHPFRLRFGPVKYSAS